MLLFLFLPLMLSLLHRARGVQDCNVRAVHLVPAESVEIDFERFDVDVAVRGERDAVDAEERVRIGAVDERGEGADVVDTAEDVGGVRAGYESGVRGQEGAEVGWCQEEEVVVVVRGGRGGGGGGGRRGRRDEGPPFDGDVGVVGCQAHPGGEVRFVVEAGKDDFAVGGESREDLREIGEELGGAGADYWQVGKR